jgi:hypothetical protein
MKVDNFSPSLSPVFDRRVMYDLSAFQFIQHGLI